MDVGGDDAAGSSLMGTTCSPGGVAIESGARFGPVKLAPDTALNVGTEMRQELPWLTNPPQLTSIATCANTLAGVVGLSQKLGDTNSLADRKSTRLNSSHEWI